MIAERLAERMGVKPVEAFEALRRAAREAREERRRGGWSDWRRGAAIVAARLGIRVEELYSAVEEALLSKPWGLPLPGARETLASLKKAGFRVGVLGNVLFWPGSLTRRILAETGLANSIDVMLFADEIGYSKPSPKAFEAIAEELGCSIDELTHVGDRVDEDVAGAVLAGARGVLAWSKRVERPVCIHERLCATPDLLSILEVLTTGRH